jgi:hypothetical protein
MSQAGHRLRIFSVGIWSAVEGMGLPGPRPGITELGPSVG